LRYSKNDEAGDVRWDDYQAFEAIAKTSSIKRAAASLGITQSALSKRLMRLERLLGARLIDRGPKGALLTYQGERVFARVLAAERELDRAARDARMAESRVEGDCSILISDGIANFWLARFMPHFLNHYPDIELKVFIDHDLGAVKNQVFNIRLHYYEPVDPTQITRPLASVHFIPFASRTYIQKFGVPISASDVLQHRIADQTQHLVSKGSWPAWFGDDTQKRTALFTNQSGFLARCVREGAGIAFMPTYMAIDDDELVPLDLGIQLPSKLYASYHHESASSQPVKTALSFLRTVVFDPKNMPWFDEQFRFPQADWLDKLNAVRESLTPASL